MNDLYFDNFPFFFPISICAINSEVHYFYKDLDYIVINRVEVEMLLVENCSNYTPGYRIVGNYGSV